MSESRPEQVDEDEQLVARAKQGDQEAFQQLVERHLPRVWRVVWKIVRHEQDAEDVAQEVFLTAWQGLATFRGDAKVTTWLHTIAVTRALNYRDRSAEKVRRASDPLELESEPDGQMAIRPAVEAAVAQAPSALERIAATELRRRLADCLRRLPPAWRAILSLRDEAEPSYEEMARVLGVAIGTVRSRLARARLSLKSCVEGQAL